jgi:hypothetical protein
MGNLRVRHRRLDLEERAVAGEDRRHIGKPGQSRQARRQMLTVNDVWFVDDFGNPVDNVMAPPSHSICHVPEVCGEQHRFVPGVPQSVREELND